MNYLLNSGVQWGAAPAVKVRIYGFYNWLFASLLLSKIAPGITIL
jgi:hypothetical protein